MRFYTSGNWYPQAPPEIHQLPMDLLKTTAYPGQPGTVQRGFAQLETGELPIMVPQRMGFTKWKKPPVPQAWGQNVIGMLDAFKHQLAVTKSASVYVDSLPTGDFIETAQRRGYTRIPPQRLDPNLRAGYVPLARGAVPQNMITDASLLNQVAQEAGIGEDVSGALARESAFNAVRRIQQSYHEVLVGNAGVPWFMR